MDGGIVGVRKPGWDIVESEAGTRVHSGEQGARRRPSGTLTSLTKVVEGGRWLENHVLKKVARI
jgi:hypothetical protein